MRVTHGYTVKGADDPMLTIQLAAMDNFTSASDVGSWLVDFIPQLQHLPRWMPGASFLKLADEFKQLERRSVRTPYLWCKERIQEGTEDPGCLVATAIRQFEAKSNEQDEAELPWAASSGLGGGLDTNMSTIFTFILAMLHYPHVQTKAQAEIDGVVGNERLPSITDRPSLPYVRSVIAEVYRWFPAAPQAIPHALRQEDVYKGYLLPKSSIIIPNIWGMLHDPSAFPQPEKFEPERFGYSDGEMRKVTDLLFGFGRRFAPGRTLRRGPFSR
ncbi:cytochrome P450 [Rhodofomes roseus]|uniref:Cytochrome P450 n=1 Tax=Rhodofomes roseus TaxID=34475 RepID=A0ABQ8KRZ6_9APHY|nr:cytochrome P450 [Rhodofomes roseus]KAH9841064.1 cytochrome P450 [Rhodofomes roseus]